MIGTPEAIQRDQQNEQEKAIAKYRAWCAEQGFTIERCEPLGYGEVAIQHHDANGTRYRWRIAPHDMIEADSIQYKPKGARRWRQPIWPNGR